MLTRAPQFHAIVSPHWEQKSLRCAYLGINRIPGDSSRNHRDCANTTSTATVTNDGFGRTLNFAAADSNARIILPARAVNGLGGVTWLAVVNATAVDDCTILHNDYSVGGGGLSWRVETGVNQLIYPGVAVLAEGPTITTNRWYAMAVRYKNGNGVSGVECTWAIDGRISAGTSLDNTEPGWDAGADPAFGAQTSGSRLWVGKIALFANWDTMLSDNELSKITTNPWQMFVDPAESRNRIIRSAYVAAGGGGGGNPHYAYAQQ